MDGYFNYNPDMRLIQILKPALFICECFRIVLIVFTLMYILPEANSIHWVAFCAPAALFPLMALFIWVDISRYRVYLPLFIAGKCISAFSLLGSSVIFRNLTMISGFDGIYIIAELVFLCCDILSLAVILLIFRNLLVLDKQKLTVTPNQTGTEEK